MDTKSHHLFDVLSAHGIKESSDFLDLHNLSMQTERAGE